MPEVRWVMSHGFCSKFHTLSTSSKIFKRFDKVTESLKVGTFFETQCRVHFHCNHVLLRDQVTIRQLPTTTESDLLSNVNNLIYDHKSLAFTVTRLTPASAAVSVSGLDSAAGRHQNVRCPHQSSAVNPQQQNTNHQAVRELKPNIITQRFQL